MNFSFERFLLFIFLSFSLIPVSGLSEETDEIGRLIENAIEEEVLTDLIENVCTYDGDEKFVGDFFVPQDCEEGYDFGKLDLVEGSVYMLDSLSLSGVKFPTTITKNLNISKLRSMDTVTLPTFVGGYINLENLRVFENIIWPIEIGGFLSLRKITTTEGFVLPKVGRGIFLDSLENVVGINFPNTVYGTLNLKSISSLLGVTLPSRVNGVMDLRSLTNTESIVLPFAEKWVYLNSEFYQNYLESSSICLRAESTNIRLEYPREDQPEEGSKRFHFPTTELNERLDFVKVSENVRCASL